MNEQNFEVRFEPAIGEHCYVYQRSDGSNFGSIIKPHEWGKNYQYKFLYKAIYTSEGKWENNNEQ